MADAAAGASPAPRKRGGTLLTILSFGLVFVIMFDAKLRNSLGNAVGLVLNPVIGFSGRYPILTVMLAGTVMVILTTLLRHFTTDWIEMAKFQTHMRAFNKELMKARKENNTFRMKKLQDQQPELMMKQQEVSKAQLKNMPLTMLVVIPLFAWVLTFLQALDYWWVSTPWNPRMDLFTTEGIVFGSSVLPHWILLYSALTIPLGALVQKGMKVLSWKERWEKLHHEHHDVAGAKQG